MLTDSVVLRTLLSTPQKSDRFMQVVPKVGGAVKIVLGKYRGEVATVVDILKDEFCAKVELHSGKRTTLEYEFFSKLVTD